MTQLSIKVKGELVRKGLQDLTAQLPKIGRQQIRTVMERIKRRMQEYPPEPPHRVKYGNHSTLGRIITKTGRTGRLGSSWAIEEITNGYRITNTASRKGREYARYVVGDAYGQGQAWMHAGRWQLTRDVADEEVARLPEEIEQEIVTVARRNNL